MTDKILICILVVMLYQNKLFHYIYDRTLGHRIIKRFRRDYKQIFFQSISRLKDKYKGDTIVD